MTLSQTQPAASATDPLSPYRHLQVWVDGQLRPAEDATVSVFDHGLLYGDGVFEGLRFYNSRVLKLRTHLNRLAESAAAIRLPLPFTLDETAQAIRDTIAANHLTDGYLRVVITRGAGTMGINPFLCPQPSLIVIAASIQLYPEDFYTHGLKILSSSYIRNHPQALSPRIKSLNYLNNVLAKIEAIDADCLEAVMYNHEGYVAECTGDNLFIIKPDHGPTSTPTIITPPLSAGVLEGITRNLVIDLARNKGLTVTEANLTRHDLYTAHECFLTGSAAEVIPVTEIDGRPLGPATDPAAKGSPGPITQSLIAAFRQLLQHAPED
ncbi:MAG: branched-chain-amino-acid transaminase [Planctomycetota bacterium]